MFVAVRWLKFVRTYVRTYVRMCSTGLALSTRLLATTTMVETADTVTAVSTAEKTPAEKVLEAERWRKALVLETDVPALPKEKPTKKRVDRQLSLDVIDSTWWQQLKTAAISHNQYVRTAKWSSHWQVFFAVSSGFPMASLRFP